MSFHFFGFLVVTMLAATFTATAEPWVSKATSNKSPALMSISDAHYQMGGELGRRLAAVTEQWIIPAPGANPQMLEMFRTQTRQPLVWQLDGAVRPYPWIGEYAGKYLTHAVQTYKLTWDKKLLEHLTPFVAELVCLQAADGYLGPWPEEMQFKVGTWDAWGHYHIMIGLLLWHEQTQDAEAFACAEKIGDMLCNRFLNTDVRILDTGSHEMNMAPIHALCLLYEKTGQKRYLELALEIEEEFVEAGDCVRAALAGREFFQTPRPRWESLHPIMGIAELYYITGDEKYREAFEHLWWSMAKCDRHNNGGFSSREAAHGDPYAPGAIETCCTVAWMALSVDMLRLTGDSRVADELELSMMNSGLGLMSSSGRWVTYDTPMDGMRYPSLQCGDAGGPRLNCCSVNGPRAIAMTCEWALMRNAEGLVVNYYGPCTMTSRLPGGVAVTLVQETDYPIGNRIDLTVNPAEPREFTLALRVPTWSKNTTISVNGQAVQARAGQYLKLNRKWTAGDRIAVQLDFTPHFWVHRQAMEPTSWNTKWTLFGPVEGFTDKQRTELKAQVAATATNIPTTMTHTPTDADKAAASEAGTPVTDQKTLTPRILVAENGIVDLDKAIDDRDRPQIAYAFAEYDSPAEDKLRLTFSASAGVVLFVNGQTVPMPPNSDNPCHVRKLSAEIPVRKGRNVIAMALPKERFFDVLWFWNTRWYLNVGWEKPAPGNRATSIYRGPILLTYDPRYNTKADSLTVMNARDMSPKLVECDHSPKPWILCEVKSADGRVIRLCDFASAGATGTFYMSWLRVHFDGETANDFTRENPLRSFRP